MRKITTLVLLLVAVATASLSSAQSVTVQEPRLSLLSVIVSKDDSVVVNVNTITAIAMHNYRLNGDNLISQVTIDTLGNNTIRFYYIHPAQEISPVDNPGQLASMTRQRKRVVPGRRMTRTLRRSNFQKVRILIPLNFKLRI